MFVNRYEAQKRQVFLFLTLTFFNSCLLRKNRWPISAAAQYRTAPRPTLLRLKLQHQQDGELVQDATHTHTHTHGASALSEIQKKTNSQPSFHLFISKMYVQHNRRLKSIVDLETCTWPQCILPSACRGNKTTSWYPEHQLTSVQVTHCLPFPGQIYSLKTSHLMSVLSEVCRANMSPGHIWPQNKNFTWRKWSLFFGPLRLFCIWTLF